jgi:hypothetical protein
MVTAYNKEVFPNYIVYVVDNPRNRRVLNKLIGEPQIEPKGYTYIEIDLLGDTWRSCLGHEWLYRNTPPLVELNDLIC